MNRLSVKAKVMLLAVIPLVVITLVIMGLVKSQLEQLGEREVDRARQDMVVEKRRALENYISFAVSSIQHLHQSDMPQAQAKLAAKEILTNLSYNNGNYIFVFDHDGTTLVHRAKPSLLGKSLLELKDKEGRFMIRDLIEAAKQGGDFVEYIWSKPSGGVGPKLSYAVNLPGWNWVVGSGFMIDDVEAHVAEVRADMEQRVAETMLAILAVGVGLLVVVLVIAAWSTRVIVKPLLTTADAMVDIAEGDGDLTRRLESRGNDEIGSVTAGFNNFASKINLLVSEVKSGIQDLTGATSEMQLVVSNSHQEAQNQRDETQQVAASIHELVAAVQQVAGNATDAASAAQRADERAAEGHGLVMGTVTTVNELAEDVNQAGVAIEQLDTYTDQITGVVNVIKDIADQTNLLALNAAIEAARAGEQGRGFSVVADEVRTLATRTQSSTDEIQQMIDRLLSGVADAVMVIERSRDKASLTLEQAEKAGSSLTQITDAVATITDMNTQIASAAEQQGSVAEEISRSVHSIANIAERSADQAHTLSGTTGEMVQLEQRLTGMIQQFRV